MNRFTLNIVLTYSNLKYTQMFIIHPQQPSSNKRIQEKDWSYNMNPIRLNTNACWLPSFPRCCWNTGFMSRHKNSNWVATGLIIHLHYSKKTFGLKLYSGKCRKPYDMGMLQPNDCISNLPNFFVLILIFL